MSTATTIESAALPFPDRRRFEIVEPYSKYRVHLMAVKRIWPWATDSLSPGIDKELSS
jgi:hypothetical protein